MQKGLCDAHHMSARRDERRKCRDAKLKKL